ncbi:hypothetical protein BpHYR1_047466 [Brachionus plicatilis]|uniref:Uncharacterized protein n=1 Tax=Brachionus plicatilis TaxID=10195 RepID=A0A3M7PKV0_BRAPC|nr:hypothetical protein BpHYR1_047466 [Brachionus plicatilis]
MENIKLRIHLRLEIASFVTVLIANNRSNLVAHSSHLRDLSSSLSTSNPEDLHPYRHLNS